MSSAHHLDNLRAALRQVLGDDEAWDRLSGQITVETVVPGVTVRAHGDAVRYVLVIDTGVFDVSTPDEPSQWATSGSVIGIAASWSGTPSEVAVTALRHGRVARVPAQALWDHGHPEFSAAGRHQCTRTARECVHPHAATRRVRAVRSDG